MDSVLLAAICQSEHLLRFQARHTPLYAQMYYEGLGENYNPQ